jgi:hypothetical protein
MATDCDATVQGEAWMQVSGHQYHNDGRPFCSESFFHSGHGTPNGVALLARGATF